MKRLRLASKKMIAQCGSAPVLALGLAIVVALLFELPLALASLPQGEPMAGGVMSLSAGSPTLALTPASTATLTSTATATGTPTPTATATLSPTLTATPTVTGTVTPTITLTATPTMTGTIMPTSTVTPTETVTPTVAITPTATITPTGLSVSILVSELQWTSAVARGSHTGKVVVEVHAGQPWRLAVAKEHDPRRADGKTIPSANLTCTSSGGDPKYNVVKRTEFSTKGVVIAGSDKSTPDEGVRVTITYYLNVGYVYAGTYTFSHRYTVVLGP